MPLVTADEPALQTRHWVPPPRGRMWHAPARGPLAALAREWLRDRKSSTLPAAHRFQYEQGLCLAWPFAPSVTLAHDLLSCNQSLTTFAAVLTSRLASWRTRSVISISSSPNGGLAAPS